MCATCSRADLPAGFSWVNLESDQATMAVVRRALHDESITAIREVGVKDGYALVMTVSRDKTAPTADSDQWKIYNLSLTSGKSRMLVSGYGVKMLDWIVADAQSSELAITYYDCWECEPATLFTTLRFKRGVGWRARWPNKTKDNSNTYPGAVVVMTDVGDPYDDNVVDQIFAVVKQPKDGFAVGSWTHTRNTKNGKVDDSVVRYSIDSATQEDRVEELRGTEALDWERQICRSSNLLMQVNAGQDSKSCLRVLHAPTLNAQPSK